jgi:AcrR family transcriptional regulator
VNGVYDRGVPKLWTETIDAHRAAVRDAALDAMAALVAEHGLVALTMSQIAEQAGIGRATLYKYFPDAQAVLTAWHERQITAHLDQLTTAADPAAPAVERLHAALHTYAHIQHHSTRHHGDELAALLHRSEYVDQARQRLRDFIQNLIAEAARDGDLRDDVTPDELATYCLHALTAAGTLPSQDAVARLVAVTLAGLRPGVAGTTRPSPQATGSTLRHRNGPSSSSPSSPIVVD